MDDMTTCQECGMNVRDKEYHPYAACLMFKACKDAETVRGNLAAVFQFGYTDGHYKGRKEWEEKYKQLATFGPESAKAKRLELGLTCREVAEKAGMRPSDVSAFEGCEYVLTMAEGDRLRAALGIKPNL